MLTLVMTLMMQATAPAAPPSAEAEMLGRRLAASGTLASVLPMMIGKDLGELAAEDKTLTAAERETLVALGRAEGKAATDQLMTAMGNGYAKRLSVADLRVLVAQGEDPATQRLRAAMPEVIAGAMGALGQVDLKKNVAAKFCAQTGKLCKRD